MNNLRWGITWFGFFGGIALLVWAVNTYGNQPEKMCIDKGGIWTQVNPGNWNPIYYQCNLPKPTTPINGEEK